jgi:cell division protein FtsB
MICIAFVVIGILCITKYANINKQKERLMAENASLVAQSEALSEKLKQIRAQEEFGQDDAYIESVARTQLDMVYPGEVIFRVTGEKYN